jgi:hypothetical protein
MEDDQLKQIQDDNALYLAGDPAGVRADFSGADLIGVDLRGADLRGANFSDADLIGAKLIGATLCGADLTGADLTGADLTGADLRRAKLHVVTLQGVILRGADLVGATFRTYTVGEGQVSTFNRRYWALTTCDDSGTRWLHYGCETHTLDEWDWVAGALAKKHHPDEADIYEKETRELVALCRTMDLSEGGK